MSNVKLNWSTYARFGWAFAIVSLFATSATFTGQGPGVDTIFGSATPHTVSSPDSRATTVGVDFSTSTAGSVTAIRFFKGPRNAGPHTGSLWTASGHRLASATFSSESRSGWQTANLAHPVAIAANTEYVVSYLAPHGHYSADAGYFTRAIHRGPLTVPASGGVYASGNAFPTHRYRASNYYVDVDFRPLSTTSGTTPTPTPTATATPTPTATASAPPTTGTSVLDLPKIAWDGGPAYWSQFSKASGAGWTNPNFFPIVVWYDGISSNAEVQYDKSVGINTYTGGMWAGTPYSLFSDNGVYWIGSKLNSGFTNDSANWVGNFLGDEVDGQYSATAGQAFLAQQVKADAGGGRFNYANFTQSVLTTDMPASVRSAYVNNYTNAVSVDMYWYTIPACSTSPFRGNVYLDPVTAANCRTSSSYGKTIDSLHIDDQADGKLQPLWQLVEDLNGGPGANAPAVYITAGQLQGAVMNSIIAGAQGIVYFNQSLSGSCQSSNVVRQSEDVAGFCGDAQVAGMKTVDSQVASLASVINTQSYQYSFGSGLDTMLKVQDGYAYIFSMIDGSSSPGSRTFKLPPGVNGTSVQVLNENRTIPVSSSGTFTDSFAKEYTYHIYKVALG